MDPSRGTPEETPEEAALVSDVDRLKIVWRNEKAAPEILAYQSDLISRLSEQIQLMEETIADSSSEPNQSLQIHLFTMDVNRASFLVRSYLRVRLSKIEEHPLQICNDPEIFERLSEREQEFARGIVDCMGKHFGQSFLDKLPDGYRSMLRQGGVNEENRPNPFDMIPKASLESFVFCRTKSAVEDLQLDETGDETVSWTPDELFILRYRPVKQLLEENAIELI